MTDNINKLSRNLDGNKQQQTLASMANLTDDDVVKIWDAVSTYIESYMKQSKGVAIPGFGTFSFIYKRVDVGNNKYLLIQRPIFVFSEKIAQTHGLKTTHYPVNGSIPVHPLNYFYIQTQSVYTRDQIEQCVKHVLQIFNRSIAAQRNVEFTFSRIGKLQIRDGKVKMRFFKDFVSAVDENGGKHVIENMCNRPQTCDSVMSAREASRPATASNVVLPRLNSRVGNPTMQVIQEENQIDDELGQELLQQESTNPTTSITKPHLIKTVGRENSHEGIIPIASLFSSMDLIQPLTTTRKPTPVHTPMRRTSSFHQIEPEKEPTPINPRPSSVAARSTNENTPSVSFVRLNADRLDARSSVSSSMSSQSQYMTSCGHYGIGQNVCHLCHQRAKRNIPVYLHEERRIREAEEDRLLGQYRDNRDLEEQKKQDAAMNAAREERQKIAAFNLGIAEATRAKKLERAHDLDVPRSIIFRKRLRTPPIYLKQQDFARQVEAQIKWRQDEERSEKLDKDFTERLEQIQLAETLAQERESYLRNKRLQQEQLKSTLQNQMRNKPSEPPLEPDVAYFGLNDMSSEKLQERRLHAMEIVRQQKDLIEQRQRQQLLKQIQEQEHELKALDIMREDLVIDRRDRYNRDMKIRKNVEADWMHAIDEKHKRDEDEKMHLKAPQGILVHEQCDQYKRCAQCQRTLDNHGKTNIWKDTRYLTGARIMV